MTAARSRGQPPDAPMPGHPDPAPTTTMTDLENRFDTDGNQIGGKGVKGRSDRVPYATAGAAMRTSLERGLVVDLSQREWRVLAACIALIGTYSRTSDTLSRHQLVGATGMDRRHVQRALHRLDDLDVIEYTPGDGRGHASTVTLPAPERGAGLAPVPDEREAELAPVYDEKGGQMSLPSERERGADLTRKGGRFVRERGAGRGPHPRSNPRSTPEKNTDAPERGTEMDVTVHTDGFARDEFGNVTPATPEMIATTTTTAIRSTARVGRDDVQQVFDLWLAETDRLGGRYKLTPPRHKVITARLREYPLADVLDAIRGIKRDPWAERVNHTELTVILRNGGQVEKFRDLWQKGPPKVRVEPKGFRAIRNTAPDGGASFDADMANLFRPRPNGQHPAAIEAHAIEAHAREGDQ